MRMQRHRSPPVFRRIQGGGAETASLETLRKHQPTRATKPQRFCNSSPPVHKEVKITIDGIEAEVIDDNYSCRLTIIILAASRVVATSSTSPARWEHARVLSSQPKGPAARD